MRSGSARSSPRSARVSPGFARTAYGIEIVDVELLHLTLPEQNREHVFERMKAERGKMAKEYRTAGELQARKIVAEADRERSHIEAESYAQAQRLKAEGDAEASRIYAAAFSQNPAFYKFLRTLQAYEKFLDENTTLFLPGDAEVLRMLVPSARPGVRRPIGARLGDGDRQAARMPTRPYRSPATAGRQRDLRRPRTARAGRNRARDERARGKRRDRSSAAKAAPARLLAHSGASRILDRPARSRPARRLLRHRLLRRQRRRARGGAPVRRHRGPRRSRHALPAALAGGPRRRAQDDQRDEGRRRFRAAGERLADRDRRRGADRRHQHPQRRAGGPVRDPQPVRLSCFRSSSRRCWSGRWRRASLTETVVGMPVDEVLTTGRLAIQARVKLKTQEVLDRYQSGIQISSVSIMSITLDVSVAQAFQDVADAMADREKTQNEARAYANDQIPRARGEANQTVSNAENYKQQRIAEAIGNTNRFLALLKEYQKAPEVTRSRIYLDAMEKILPKVKMYVIDSQGGRVPVNLRVTTP